jgi:hypothetical protein
MPHYHQGRQHLCKNDFSEHQSTDMDGHADDEMRIRFVHREHAPRRRGVVRFAGGLEAVERDEVPARARALSHFRVKAAEGGKGIRGPVPSILGQLVLASSTYTPAHLKRGTFLI